jgi:hypothetical protein
LGQAPVLADEIMNKSIYDDLSDNAKLVFETLPLRSGYEAGEIANRSGLARVEVISALSELQIHSAIRKGTTGWVIDSRANVRQPALPDAC